LITLLLGKPIFPVSRKGDYCRTMNNTNYDIPKEKISSDEILDLVFKDASIKHGLREFSSEILRSVNPFEKENGIQSHQARKMAKNLLEKAKREVEGFVEKNRIKEK
jgi:hypothetical protein